MEVARIPIFCLQQLCYGLIQLYDTMAEVLGLRPQRVRRVLRGAICNGCIPLLADFGGYGFGCGSERVAAIQRGGQREDFDVLSGGTKEQLAVLTRLAFAELLLGQGRPATVILDDALAFSDDDRIESMFDVLTRAGDKVQIIVLTCRKRLFTRLGAALLEIRETT